jgi:hypothetical protein
MNDSTPTRNKEFENMEEEEVDREPAERRRPEIEVAMAETVKVGNQEKSENNVGENPMMSANTVNQRKVGGIRKYEACKRTNHSHGREETDQHENEVQLYGSIIFPRFDK